MPNRTGSSPQSRFLCFFSSSSSGDTAANHGPYGTSSGSNRSCSLIQNSYCLQEFDPTSFGLYDLYYVLQKPARVRFYFAGQEHRIVALPPLVRLDDQEFEDVYDFFREAMLDGEKLTSIYEELTDFTLLT